MSWCLQCSILSIIGLSIFLIQYAHRCLCSFHICSLTSLSTFEGMPYFHVLVLLYLYNHISAYDPKYSRIICIGIDNRYSAINPSKFFIHTSRRCCNCYHSHASTCKESYELCKTCSNRAVIVIMHKSYLIS